MPAAAPRVTGPALSVTPAAPTVVGLIAANARSHGGSVAMRRYELGRWREHTWSEVAAAAGQMAAGLSRLGVSAGDRVALVASNRPEWFVADVAVQSLGAVSVGIDPRWPDVHVASVLALAGCRAVVVEDGAELDRAAAARATCPTLDRAVVIDEQGLELTGAHVASWSGLVGASSPTDANDAIASLEHAAASIGPGDPAVVVFPGPGGGPPGSQSSPAPRGVLFSHASLLAGGASLAQALALTADDELVAHLPLADLTGRVASTVAPALARAVVSYGVGTASLGADLRLVQPTLFLAEMGVWEVVRAEVERRMNDASRIKRRAYQWARRSGTQETGGAVAARARWVLDDRSLRAKLGLSRLRLGLADSTPPSDGTLDFFSSLGVGVARTFSHLESGGFVAAGDGTSGGGGTNGRLVPGMEVTIDAEGLLHTRGPATFAGYVAHAVAGPPGPDGWVSTGRAASIDADGHLTVAGSDRPTGLPSGPSELDEVPYLEETGP